MREVVENLQEIQIQAYDIKECWESLSGVMDIKSILGQLDEFKYISKIMENDKYDNPALNLGFYKVDQDCLDQLKKAVLIARDTQLKEIKLLITQLLECKMIEKSVHAEKMQNW